MSARFDGDRRRDLGIVLGGLAPLVVAMALVPLRTDLQNANVALILVVFVVLAAAAGGRPAGTVAAISAAMAFSFFHTRPYLRLHIDSADDLETTLLLLVVGLVVGHLAGRERQAKHLAHTEIRRIHRVADFTARGEEATIVILAAETELIDLLHLEACHFESTESGAALPRFERNGTIGLTEYRWRSGGFALPAGGVDLPVYGRGAQLGRFVIVPASNVAVSLEQRMIAVAIADQVGAALTVPAPGRGATPGSAG